MLLIVTNVTDATADFFEGKLKERRVPFFRFNTDQAITNSVHNLTIRMDDKDETLLIHRGVSLDMADVSSVWYRRPMFPEIPKEITSPQAQRYIEEETHYYLKCLWRMLGDRNWVSPPWAISWAQTKLAQLKIAKELGMTIPSTLVTTDPDEVVSFYKRHKRNIVVKPFKESFFDYGDGKTSTIFTSKVTKKDLEKIDQVRYAPTFFQENIKKVYELRVTVFGEEVFAARTDSQNDPKKKIDWRHVSQNPLIWEETSISNTIRDQSVAMVKRFGLKFGALDFAVTPKGEHIFFEINPNGQWAWLEIQLGVPMSDSLIKLLV